MDAFWPSHLKSVLGNQACVMVTVVSVKGSAPRAVGSRMLITRDGQHGSIGGGNLEYEATGTARELLENASAPLQQHLPYGLGPALNQCCGGAVTLLFESCLNGEINWLDQLLARHESGSPVRLLSAIDRAQVSKWVLDPKQDLPDDLPAGLQAAISAFPDGVETAGLIDFPGRERFFLEPVENRHISLHIFGAGHVARAVVQELERQPFQIQWSDSRADQFPDHIPENVFIIPGSNHAEQVLQAPEVCNFLVMTHSHQLDEDICYAALQRRDASWLGLIGSKTKRKRFEHRLQKRGIDKAQLNKIVCPVGVAGITGKRPATIALSIAAQLLIELVPENWR